MSRGDDPAYPTIDPENPAVDGMTIREAFVKAAMQGTCASNEYGDMGYQMCAEHAVAQADALLAELAKGTDPATRQPS